MKKIISFEKELDFPSMIGDITSISLDHTINFIDSSSASGKFIVSGTYKMTEASTLNEEFNYDIPVDITLTEKLELDSSKIYISDFSYEIVNDDILKCKIDLALEGVEEIVLEKEEVEKEEEIELIESTDNRDDDKKDNSQEDDDIKLLRECDGDKKRVEENEIEMLQSNNIIENEIEIPKSEIIEDQILEEVDDKNAQVISNNIMKKEYDSKSSNISSLFQVFENSEETFKTYSVYIMRKEDTLEKVLDTYNVSREQLSEYNDLGSIEVGSKIVIPSSNE